MRTDPAKFSPAQWQARHAGLRSHGANDDDPQVAECLAALAYWRCRRVIDAEATRLDSAHADALADLLHQGVPA